MASIPVSPATDAASLLISSIIWRRPASKFVLAAVEAESASITRADCPARMAAPLRIERFGVSRFQRRAYHAGSAGGGSEHHSLGADTAAGRCFDENCVARVHGCARGAGQFLDCAARAEDCVAAGLARLATRKAEGSRAPE